MTAAKDPLVGRALDLFVPDYDADVDAVLSAAHVGAAGFKAARRRRQTVAALALALLLLVSGAAIAGNKLDWLGLLQTNGPDSSRFSVSTSGRYRGAVAPALACQAPRAEFVCHVTNRGHSGRGTYVLGERTAEVPLVTRQSMLAWLDHAQKVDPARGRDRGEYLYMRRKLAGVGDDFVRALAVLTTIETVGAGRATGVAGSELVPVGRPTWLACGEVTPTTFRCRPLRVLAGVTPGTPLYYLKPSHYWHRATTTPPEDPNALWFQLEELLGRKPTAREIRFFVLFEILGVGRGTSSYGPHLVWDNGPLINGYSASSRGAALLAPQMLGVRARVVHSSGRELPPSQGPLPRRQLGPHTQLHLVVFDRLGPHGARIGRHALFVYVSRATKLDDIWRVVWVAMKS